MANFAKIQKRWKELRYWQKGAVIGAGAHVFALLFLLIGFFIFVPRSSAPGSGDMGPASAWIFLIVYGLIELLPGKIFNLFTKIDHTGKLWIWSLFLCYSTFFYAGIGIMVAKIVQQGKWIRVDTKNEKNES